MFYSQFNIMKTTRRGLFTTLAGLIAIPLLPRATHNASAALAPTPPPAPTLRDILASQQYPGPGAIGLRDPFQHWNTLPRQPISLADIESREECIRCELHGQKLTPTHPGAIRHLEAALDECQLARRILSLQPTGRPIIFRYTGGSARNQSRIVLPTMLFQTQITIDNLMIDRPPAHLDPIYLQAYCIDRLAPRTFRLDRIKEAVPLRNGDHRSPT